ncbi:MAG TPA: hypothetical protein PKZ29_01480 [Candidatus Woesebacteria bacterium]|nr:hypothetical protein [Candidatus Woesebacteria bacterium]HOG37575.1 hypothetical protein [Candidatus Woesebacteria bacterium]
MDSYNFFLLFGLTAGLYLISAFLVKFKKLSPVTQRRFWNLVLLISFLVSGLTGLFFAFAIDQNRHLPNYLTGLWLHVEFGIVMATIAIFHALWHLPYFRGIFPTKPKK